MLQTYEQFGRKFDLDVVLFSWDTSDLTDNVRSDLYRLKNGRLERANTEYLPAVNIQDMLMRYRVYRFVADHSQLYTFVRDRMSLLLKMRLQSERKQSLDCCRPRRSGGRSDIRSTMISMSFNIAIKSIFPAAILTHADEVVSASGADFYLLDIPARLSRTEFASPLGFCRRRCARD